MKRNWMREKSVQSAKTSPSNQDSEQVDGYKLLMDIIDRKVFQVEDESVSSTEFKQLSQWMVSEYNKSTDNRVGGKVILRDPILLVEVIADEPVFIEIHDYKARYRVNVYQESEEVVIQVEEPVRAKTLAYQKTPVGVLSL